MDNTLARTALVTGAASGMGLATVERLVAAGWRVLALDVAATAADASAPSGAGVVVPIVADVRSREAVSAAIDSALDADGRIDLVANIAGVYPPTTLETFDESTYRRVFDINVLGVVNVVVAARPRLGDGSSVVNFASVDAFEVSPGQLLYGASKAAVVMLTKSLALELAPAGIRVNGIAPGWVATPGNAATGRMAAAEASIPLGRVARPTEIAA
ncbi:3-oxoacyl-[acyl-carrier protein] reductase [Pseudoclavibacter chungangensis]|uniref:SDR family NAD(P)-dependent oxidoreductase n=1 Tax=Pseudoclavibacter chungangensis TaxID=587635 RepID=UPI0017CFC9FA|nr:SDR family oxidoreductase [Pseudoclavibacter chungangensis]NYJ66585.1 3-oxoacyl-[acyl-carrier protein] reductase [Pseudoclavibacter chungangensis]